MPNEINSQLSEALEPPKDIEAEKAVLGSMMLSDEAVQDVVDILKPEDFYLKEHQEIYKMFMSMFRRSITIDLMTTRAELNKVHQLELVGGMTYLSRLSGDAINPSNAKFYALAVVDKSKMRKLIKSADTMRKNAYDGSMDSEQILDEAEKEIFSIAQASQRKNYSPIQEVLQTNILQINELVRNKGQLPGITTGFRDIDKMLGGLKKTDLVVLAARPGMGKTAFALNVAENAAMAGHHGDVQGTAGTENARHVSKSRYGAHQERNNRRRRMVQHRHSSGEIRERESQYRRYSADLDSRDEEQVPKTQGEEWA